MFGIYYVFISSNRRKRTVNCTTVYETRQRNKHSQSSHEGSASWLSSNPVMVLCHCDIHHIQAHLQSILSYNTFQFIPLDFNVPAKKRLPIKV